MTREEGNKLLELYNNSEHKRLCVERTGGSGKPFETCSWAAENGVPGMSSHIEVWFRQRIMSNDPEIEAALDDWLPERDDADTDDEHDETETAEVEQEQHDEQEQQQNHQNRAIEQPQQRTASGKFQ